MVHEHLHFSLFAGLLPQRLPAERRRAEEEEEAAARPDPERGAGQAGGQEELLPHRRPRHHRQQGRDSTAKTLFLCLLEKSLAFWRLIKPIN